MCENVANDCYATARVKIARMTLLACCAAARGFEFVDCFAR